jgi:hypothetical protein
MDHGSWREGDKALPSIRIIGGLQSRVPFPMSHIGSAATTTALCMFNGYPEEERDNTPPIRQFPKQVVVVANEQTQWWFSPRTYHGMHISITKWD